MAKILKNNTLSDILISDTGISISASSQYTIPSQDYPLWASSSDIITHIGSGDIIVNDGTSNLSKADGVSILQGNFKQADFVDSLKESGALKVNVTGLNLNSDNVSEGNSNLYFTDERAQDAVGQILTDSASVDFSYDDNNAQITADVIPSGIDHSQLANLDSGDPHPQYLKESDNLLKTPQVIKVKIQDAGEGEFTSLNAAIASITDADWETKPYLVEIEAGIHEVNNPLVIPSGVTLKGKGINATILQALNEDEHMLVMSPVTEILFMSMWASPLANGSNKAGIYCEDVQESVLLHKVSIYGFDICVSNLATTTSSTVYLEYVDFSGNFTYGLKNISENGEEAFAQLENFYTYEYENVAGIHIFNSGTNTKLIINSAGLRGADDNKGVVFNNGGIIDISDTFIKGFGGTNGYGLHNENTGSGTVFQANAISIIENVDNNNSFVISNPNTNGSVSGSVDRSRVSIVSGANIAVLILDPTENGLIVNGPLYYGPTDYSSVTDISALLGLSTTMGLLSGGNLSIDSGLSLSIDAGVGYLSLAPDLNIRKITWNNTTTSLSASTSVYVYIDKDGIVNTNASLPDLTTNILLGRVTTNASSIMYIEESKMDSRHAGNKFSKKFREALGPIFVSGALVSETGTRQLLITSGSYYFAENAISLTGGNPITFDAFYRSASPGVFSVVASQTTVSNTQYDDNSGTLASIPSSKYAKHLLIAVGGDLEKYLLIYAQNVYDTQLEAEASSLPNVPSFVKDSFVRISSIVVQEGSTNIISVIDERPRIGFASPSTSGGVTDHGALAGLDDDDHTQYMLSSGVVTDNAITRYNGTGGRSVQNSSASVDDNGGIIAGAFVRPADTSNTTAGNIRYNPSSTEMHAYVQSAWRNLGIIPQIFSSTSSTSTTSGTYSTISGMTTSLSAGTYLVIFSFGFDVGNDNNGDVAVFLNGAEQTNTTRNLAINSSGLAVSGAQSDSGCIITSVTLNSTQTLDVRFRENATGTLVITNRQLIIIPIAR